MLFRLSRILLSRPILHTTVKHTSTQNLPKVNVRSSVDDSFIEISFKHEIFPRSNRTITFLVEKEQTLHQVIKRIKPLMSLTKERNKMNQYIESVDVAEEVSGESDIDVAVIKEDIVLDNDIKNIDAWTEGSLLKIGDVVFEVHYNVPTIKELSLPQHIVAGCFIRPHVIFDCALIDDCECQWFRNMSCEEISNESDEKNWLKVGENFMYQVSPDDVGHELKVVCTAKHGEKLGQTNFAVSKKVEACPDSFPFVERHQILSNLADSDCIRCASYNTLAKVYVERKRFPYCSRKARDEYYRKQLLLKEIIGFNSDILCLQEVQERAFELDFLPVLKSYGLDGVYNKKNQRGQDGLAIFYRTTKFKPLEKQHVHLNVIAKDKNIVNDLFVKVSGSSTYKDLGKLLTRDTVLQLVLLQHVDEPTKMILVANTHLYANKDTPEVRLIQSALCTSYAQYTLKSMENARSAALIFCGDFNSLPESAAYKFITEGIYDCSSTWKNNSSIGNHDMTLHHGLTLASACGTPKYTNFTEAFYGCLDYIFYSIDNFHVDEVVPMPPHDEVTKQIALPSEFFPSDHLPLICTFRWKSCNACDTPLTIEKNLS